MSCERLLAAEAVRQISDNVWSLPFRHLIHLNVTPLVKMVELVSIYTMDTHLRAQLDILEQIAEVNPRALTLTFNSDYNWKSVVS